MVWAEQWSHAVDATELNDRHVGAGPLGAICQVPEINNLFAGEIVLVQAQNNVPWFHRVQPREGMFTFLISVGPCTWAQWETRRAVIDALFAAGPHTYTAQVRGMTSPKTWTIIADGGSIASPVERLITYRTTVLEQA